MKILVTGSEGFIGKHLCGFLKHRGHAVVGYDGKNMDWCQDTERLEERAGGCEFVYHLAATVGVQNVVRNPGECINNNLDALNNVKRLGLPGIYTSSSEVYGTQRGPLREDGQMTLSSKKRWSYAASKLCGEWLWMGEGRKSVRLFNVVGVGQNESYGAVFPTFIRQALNGENITVHGYGDQVRSFTSVRDVVRILDELREKDFDVVNIGAESSDFSILGLAQIVKTVLGSRSEIEFVPYPHGEGFQECPERIPYLYKLQRLLGKQEYHHLDETIKEVAESVQAGSTETAVV